MGPGSIAQESHFRRGRKEAFRDDLRAHTRIILSSLAKNACRDVQNRARDALRDGAFCGLEKIEKNRQKIFDFGRVRNFCRNF